MATLPDPADCPAPWLRRYPRGVPPTYRVPSVALDRLLDDAAQDFPESVALAYGRRRLTYRELLDQSDRLATGLARLGVGPRAVVGVALGRTPQAVVALFAAWRLRAAVGLLPPKADATELAETAGRVGCRVVVCEDRHVDELDRLEAASTVLLTGPEDALAFPRNLVARARRHVRPGRRGTRLSDVIHRNRPLGSGDEPYRPGADTGPAVVTAGGGELHEHTAAEMLAAAFHLRLWIPDTVSGGERLVSGLPLHTPLGLTATVTMPVLAGATIGLTERDSRRALARAVESVDATLLLVPPGRAGRVVGALRRTNGSLRICLESGPVDHATVREVESRVGARLRGAWAPPGCPGFVVAEPVYGRTKPGSAGIPVTDTRVLVVDDAGRTAAPGVRGRLYAAGPQTGCTDGSWLDTGACGWLDAEGYLHFGATDRAAD